MWCPACKSELIRSDSRKYQTLDEHICCPNRTPFPRTTLACSNSACATRETGTFWALDGEGPYSDTFTSERGHNWIDGNPVPFGSYHRAIHFSCSYHDEDKEFTLGNLTIRRKVSYESDDYGHKSGKRVAYSIWWKNVRWRSGLRMLCRTLKRFYRTKALSEDMGTKELKNIVRRAAWPRAEWWRKAAKLWVQVFHRKLFNRAIAVN